MKTQNETKAIEIVETHLNDEWYQDINQVEMSDVYEECLSIAREAMWWKENQIIKWLYNNFDIHIHDSSVVQGDFDKKFENFDDFIEYMKKDLEKGE